MCVCTDIREENVIVGLKHFSSPTNQYSMTKENFDFHCGISRSFVQPTDVESVPLLCSHNLKDVLLSVWKPKCATVSLSVARQVSFEILNDPTKLLFSILFGYSGVNIKVT